jgi:hypothetical protein
MAVTVSDRMTLYIPPTSVGRHLFNHLRLSGFTHFYYGAVFTGTSAAGPNLVTVSAQEVFALRARRFTGCFIRPLDSHIPIMVNHMFHQAVENGYLLLFVLSMTILGLFAFGDINIQSHRPSGASCFAFERNFLPQFL